MEIEITEERSRVKSSTALLWLGIISMLMLFAGLTSAYIIRQAKGEWMSFELPFQFYVSTAIILLGSVTMVMATIAVKKNNLNAVTTNVALTLMLGIAFVIFQVLGWKSMTENGIFFTGAGSNVSASFIYVITALHLCHVFGGIVALSIVLFKALRKRYNAGNRNGLDLLSIYWHFLGALWIYLIIFINYLR